MCGRYAADNERLWHFEGGIARGASSKFSNFVLSQFIRDYIDLSVMHFLPTIESRIARIKEF